jgi:hypothetical protein
MGIYLGSIGEVELKRLSLEGAKESIVNPSDINTTKNRFSFDFDEGYLITGDLIEITATDGTDLDFIAASAWANNTVQSSGNWYVFIDGLGGIKLYSTFSGSLDGGTDDQISLTTLSRDIPISVKIRDRDSRLLAAVTGYELNTDRETVDITALSEEHRQQYSSLISGNGSLTANWDYVNNQTYEPVHYLMQLVLRTEIGSSFHGKFYIKKFNGIAQSGSFTPDQANDELWWEFDALVTSSAVDFTPDSVIVSRINFVTTGPVRLRARTQQKRYLLQEDSGKIALEQDDSSYVLLEEVD